MASSSRLRWLLAIVVVALAVRVGAILWVGADAISFGDARSYLDTAAELCQTHSYPESSNLPFFRAPGLPLLIAAATFCDPDRILAVKLALSLLDVALAAIVFFFAARLSGSTLAAALAALGVALHPLLVFQVTDIRSEPLFSALATAALVTALTAAREPRKMMGLSMAAGCLLGLAALTRPIALAGLPYLVLCRVAWPQARLGPRIASAVVLALGCALVLGPWTVRNALAHGDLILVNDAFGYNLWRGAHPELNRALESSDAETFAALAEHFEAVTSPRTAAEVRVQAASPAARSRVWTRRSAAIIVDDPGAYARSAVRKLARYWRPWLDPRVHSMPRVILSGLVSAVLFVFAAAGLVHLWRVDRWLAATLIGWLVVFWLAQTPFQVVMRFRLATAEPIALVLAGFAVASFLERATRVADCSGSP
jgi:hypothetical protein